MTQHLPRWRTIVAYAVLALAVATAFGIEHHDFRVALRHADREADATAMRSFMETCNRQNQNRQQIRTNSKAIRDGFTALATDPDEKRISPQLRQAAREVADAKQLDCSFPPVATTSTVVSSSSTRRAP